MERTNAPQYDVWKSDYQLFQKQSIPQCYNMCARTDIDVVLLPEMECTFKCLITYRQAYKELMKHEQALKKG